MRYFLAVFFCKRVVPLIFSFFFLGCAFSSDKIVSNSEELQLAVDSIAAGDRILVRDGVYKGVFRISGKRLSDLAYIQAFPGSVPVFYGDVVSGREEGVLSVTDSANIVIAGLFFASGYGSGVSVCGASVNITVKNNFFVGDFGWSPIKTCFDSRVMNIFVLGNSIYRSLPKPCPWDGAFPCWAEMISLSGVKNAVVLGNYIGLNERGEGIDIKDGSSGVYIYNNVVERLGAAGIYVDARGMISGVYIYNNVLSDLDGNGLAVANEVDSLGGSDIENIYIVGNVVKNVKKIGVGVGWYSSAKIPRIKNIYVLGNSVSSFGYPFYFGCSKVKINNLYFDENIYDGYAVSCVGGMRRRCTSKQGCLNGFSSD